MSVDHKTEAELVNEYFKTHAVSDTDTIRLGQMNATLALVEQMECIANLLGDMQADTRRIVANGISVEVANAGDLR